MPFPPATNSEVFKAIELLCKHIANSSTAEQAFISTNIVKIFPLLRSDAELRRLIIQHSAHDGGITRASRRIRASLALDPSSRAPSDEDDQGQAFYQSLRRTLRAWSLPFIGDVRDIFHAVVRKEASKFDNQSMENEQRDYYAKVMPIVQSSGAGKSRLIDRYGVDHLGVAFTFRIGDQNRYPPQEPGDSRAASWGLNAQSQE